MISCASSPRQRTVSCLTRRRHQHGFTLIELMICVVILGLLASWAAPGLANLSARMTLDSEVERVWQLLRRARMEAVQSGQQTWLCASRDGQSCNENQQWNTTLLLFIDDNDNRQFDIGERRLATSQPAGNQVSIDVGSLSAGIGYSALGFTLGRRAGSIRITNPALGTTGKKIVVHFARIRIETLEDTVTNPSNEA